MRQDKPSRTAEYMAFFRGLESVRGQHERLFLDPFAAYFVRPGLKKAIDLSGHRSIGKASRDTWTPGCPVHEPRESHGLA